MNKADINTYIDKIKAFLKRIARLVARHPFISTGIILGALILLLIAGNVLRGLEKPAPTPKPTPLTVTTYKIGKAPRIKLQAKVEKENVIKITAEAGGVVSGIWVSEGEEIGRGQTLLSLATNYAGGNAASVSREVVQKQKENAEAVYPLQKEALQKQKDIAGKTKENAEELRNITEQSISETEGLISLNESILSSLETNLGNFESTNSAGANNTLILSTKQLKSQYQSALNTLRSALRSSQYQTDEEKPAADLSNLTYDLTVKQLEVQEKSLELSREIANLQYRLALVNEGLYYPSAPFAGTVQRVHVRLGQSVTPGTVLFTLSGNEVKTDLLVFTSKKISEAVSWVEPSELVIENQKYELFPQMVSGEAVEGTLYQIRYHLPEEITARMTDGEFVELTVPFGYANTTSIVPFVPINAVYQTGEGAYLYLAKQNKARSAKVILGEIYGQFVEVQSGLKSGDEIILDRTVIENENIRVM